jgi:hypothetical protein
MSKVKRLIESYARHISIPWRSGTSAPQRVIFAVYNENDELQLRSKIEEFEINTKKAEHEWIVFDITDSLAEWISEHPYKESYFKNPELLKMQMEKYLEHLHKKFKGFIKKNRITENYVVAIMGVGSLFDTIKVRNLVDSFAPLVKGRLLVLFPGTYDNNTYRLLDASDGWNYLAIPITSNLDI